MKPYYFLNGRTTRTAAGPLAVAALLTLAACAAPSSRTVARPVAAPAPPPSTEVYFYPAKGQSPVQQERDRYECYLWARAQTSFDPSSPTLAPHQRLIIEPAPPSGEGVAAGATAGALIGAIVSHPRQSGEGALVGAITGAMIGAASESAAQAEAERTQAQVDRVEAERVAAIERQAERYRRAMAACLQGRGYTVH